MSSPATRSRSPSLSKAASDLVSRLSQLLRRLRDLENEEATLDAQAYQLVGQLPEASNRAWTPAVSTSASTLNIQATKNAINRDVPRTPSRVNPRNIETPMKALLLMESFALAMSVKSKRKGRIFLGDSTELRKERRAAASQFKEIGRTGVDY